MKRAAYFVRRARLCAGMRGMYLVFYTLRQLWKRPTRRVLVMLVKDDIERLHLIIRQLSTARTQDAVVDEAVCDLDIVARHLEETLAHDDI